VTPATIPATTPINYAPTTNLTHTVSLTTAAASTIFGSDPNYTLMGGNAESIYAESVQTGSALDLQHTNWTVIANGNAATITLPAAATKFDYGQDAGLGSDTLYANTAASPDASKPTLSMAADSNGVTADLSYDSVNVLNIESNGYIKNTEAYGFHHLTGGSGDDLFNVTSAYSMSIDGGSGSDTLHLIGNGATVNMSSATVTGSNVLTLVNVEHVQGSESNDLFLMGTAAETISGNGGTDVLSFQNVSQNVTVELNSYGFGSATVGTQTDLIEGISIVIGGAGNDVIVASYDGATLYGGAGNDTLIGGLGDDSLDGGAGTNVLSYANASDSGVSILLADTALLSGTASGGSVGSDTFTNMERYVGTAYADTFQLLSSDTKLLKGSAVIDGGAGSDQVFVDTTGNLTVTMNSSGGTIVSAAGGSVGLLNIERVAAGLGADVLTDASGTHVLAGGWLSQADADLLVSSASTVTDANGTNLSSGSLVDISGNARFLTYEDASHDVYRVTWSAASGVLSQTALLMTPEGTASNGFVLSQDGHSAVYDQGLSLYYYNADTKHVANLEAHASQMSTSGVFDLSRDGIWAAYANYSYQSDYGISVVNTQTGAEVLNYDWGSTAISQVAFAANGRELFILSGGTLSLLEIGNDGYSASDGGTVSLSNVTGFTVAANGTKLVYSAADGFYYASEKNGVWTTTNLVSADEMLASPTGTISENGRFVAYWDDGGTTSSPVIYDTLTDTTVTLGALSGDLNAKNLTFSDDGHYLFVTTNSGVVSEVNPYFTASTGDANTLIGGNGADTLIGGLDISSSSLLSVAYGGGDPLTTINAGNTLIAGSGTMVMIGGGGSNDFVLQASSLGHETILGGGLGANQLLNLSAVTANLTVDLGSSIYDETANQLILSNASGAVLANDYISNIGNVIGGAGATSVLIGNQNGNTLIAGSGAATTFVGHGGADQIYFGAHTNVMILTDDYHAETVHLDNAASAKEYLEAEGEVGLIGGTKVSNDLVLYFSGESGGGSIVFADYFLSSNSNVLLEIVDGGTFVRTNGETTVTAHLTSSLGSMTLSTLIAGTTGADFLMADHSNMLLLGSSAALSQGVSSHGDDFFVNGNNEVVIGASGADDTAYYSQRTTGITADLSVGYTVTLNLSGSNVLGDTASHVFSGMNVVTAAGSTDYLYSIDEIVGTNYGDKLIGGHYSTSNSAYGNDVAFRVGTGANTVVNAGALGTSGTVNSVSTNLASLYLSGSLQSGTYYASTGVLVDYLASGGGITADLSAWDTTQLYTESLTGGYVEKITKSGTVVHDGVTDTLYGVSDIRGSAYDDMITLSLAGSFVRSSKGNDTYVAMASSNTMDYSDAVGGALINLSGSTTYLNWTLSDGNTITLTLAGDGQYGTVAHDYTKGAFYTDTLVSAAGSFTDIQMSNDGGALIGTGWTSGNVTMDLQGLDSTSGALIDIAGNGTYGVVSGWNGSSSILFSDVVAIKGTAGNDTFVLSGSENPETLIGNGGTDVLDVANVGWHTWNGSTVSLTLLGESVVLSSISLVSNEITESGSSLLLNNVSGETANVATLYLADGQVLWSDDELYSIKGSLTALQASGSVVGATAGDLIVAETGALSGISYIDGNSSHATLELTNSVLGSALDFSAYANYRNIEVLQIDGQSSGVTLSTTAHTVGITELMMDFYFLTQGSPNFTTDLSGMTLYLGGGATHNYSTYSVMTLDADSMSHVAGFSDVKVGEFTYHTATGDLTYNVDSVVANLGYWAAEAGIHTLDLSSFHGYSSIALANYNDESLTVLGGSGADLISIDAASGVAGTFVLEGGNSDVLYINTTIGGSGLQVTMTGSGYAVLTNGGNDKITLEGIHLVQTSTSEVLVMGADVHTVSLDLAIGETLNYIMAATQATGVLTAQASEGVQTVVLASGYTAYLSVGYDPGDSSSSTGDHVVGTATLGGDVDLAFGSHINMDVSSASSHDLMDVNGHDFNAAGGDLKILAEAGSVLNTYDSMVLMTNMLSDTGSFAHITGLDSYAADGVALSLSYSDTSITLVEHYAYSTTGSYYGGNGNDEYIVGGHGDQTLSGGGGADEILAVSGDDTVIVGDNRFAYLDGGSGSSKLSFAFTSAATIDLTGSGASTSATVTGGSHRSDSVEHFDMLDLANSHSSTLVLNEDAVYSAANDSNSQLTAAGVSASNASHALIIGGTSGDVLKLNHDSDVGGSGWTTTGATTTLTVDGASHSYQVYTSTIHGVTEHLYVDTHVSVSTS
jgi:hypothetical protein